MPLRFPERTGSGQSDRFSVASHTIAFGLEGDDQFDVVFNNGFAVGAGGPGNDTYIARNNSALTIFDTGGEDTFVANGIGLNRTSSFAATLDNGRHLVAWDNVSGQTVYVLDWEKSGNEIERIELADTTLSFNQLQSMLTTLPGFQGDMTFREFAAENPSNDAISEAIDFYEGREQELLGNSDTGGAIPDIQGRVFVEEGGAVTASERLEVFGRSGGNEAVSIAQGVRGVELDANMERIDLPSALDEYAFEVTNLGLQAFTDDTPVVTMPSANQDIQVRFADGSATLRQTGATTFEIVGDGLGETIDGDRSTPNLLLGGDTSAAVSAVGTSADTNALDVA